MGPKRAGSAKGGKGKKAKVPAYYTYEEGVDHLAIFGVQHRDILQTPLGITVTVLGVKYDGPYPAAAESGRVWAEYPGGKAIPLEPRASMGAMAPQGYKRATEAAHIWRDVTELRFKLQAEAEARRQLEENHRMRIEALMLANAAPKKGSKPAPPRPKTAP